MCTAVAYKTRDHYFGRNLDLEYSYKEEVTITPRNYPLHFRHGKTLDSHYAIIGMAYIQDNYPLYYEGTNEVGISMAGLNFPKNAVYYEMVENRDNITPFEFIPWILGQCKDMKEVKDLLSNINLLKENYSLELPLSPLHWIISHKEESITVEAVADGMKVYDNPVGVLTNNPTFDYHMTNLTNYMGMSVGEPANNFSQELKLETYCKGMGAIFLPGDYSSASRFVKASFVKMNSVSGEGELESVNQFFHILKSVEMPRGLVNAGEGKYEMTIYSSCCNTDKGIYYYTTYDNSGICAIDMNKEQLMGSELISYPLIKEIDVKYQN